MGREERREGLTAVGDLFVAENHRPERRNG
jgi:hypothetical protein